MKLLVPVFLVIFLVACSAQPPLDGVAAIQEQQPILENTMDEYPFVGISQWYNLGGVVPEEKKSLERADLEGKVVLVDFWTYSCINCVRTLAYLTSWDEKYRDDGLVIVGVHSPEFAFEKKPENVQAAIAKHSIQYPVGLDNDFATWKAYNNRWWPHLYVFDRDGKLVFDHIGEGGYDEIEAKLQDLLATKSTMTHTTAPAFGLISTPELYLGAHTNRGNVEYSLSSGERTFVLSDKTPSNTVQLGGNWTVSDEYIEAGSTAQLRLKYNAKDIHIVAEGEGSVDLQIDGILFPGVVINGSQLYTLASTEYKTQTILLSVSQGVRIYTFTFG